MKFLDISGLTQVWDAIKDRFQPKLVSGTNIKTINGQSILGEGNLVAGEEPTYYVPSYGSTAKRYISDDKPDWGEIQIVPRYMTTLNGDWASSHITIYDDSTSGNTYQWGVPQLDLYTNHIQMSRYMTGGATAPLVRLDYGSLTFFNNRFYPQSDAIASYDMSGVTLSGKTENDLLHAAGGTISIDYLKSQIGGGDYLPLSGGTLTGNVTLMGNGGRIINNVSPNPYLGVQDSAGAYTTLNPSEIIIASGSTNMQVLTLEHSHQDEYAAPLSKEEILAILI